MATGTLLVSADASCYEVRMATGSSTQAALAWLARLLVVLMCSLWLSGCSEKPLRLGIHPWIGYDVIPMAQQWNWVGPEVELVTTLSGADSLSRMASGELHAACLTLDEAMRGLDQGLPLSVIVIMNVSSGADSLLARSDIPSIAALRGRRVATHTAGVGMLTLTAALASAGLSLADVELVDADPTALDGLWQSGAVDAVAAFEPVARALRDAGATTLQSSRDTPELIFDVIAVRRDAIAGRQKTLTDLVNAVIRAQSHVHDNPIDAIYRLASLHDRSIAVTDEDLRGVVIPTAEAQDAYFRPDSRLSNAVRQISTLFLDAGITSRSWEPTDLLDSRFLPEPAS